jgi:hypothetical protein
MPARSNGRALVDDGSAARDAHSSMIDEVDESLRALIRQQALNGSDVDVSFEAPTKEWASRRNKPTVDVYLYDVREDVARRSIQYEEVRDEDGRVVSRQPPPRRIKLSYLVTAWTKRPEDEHRLLSAILRLFLRYDSVPREVLAGSLAEQPFALLVGIAWPPGEDRSLTDVWSALGGELKPSLDLVIVAPLETGREEGVGPPVLEVPRLDLGVERVPGKGNGKRTVPEPQGRAYRPPDIPLADETVVGGKEPQLGRHVRVRTVAASGFAPTPKDEALESEPRSRPSKDQGKRRGGRS